MSTKLFILFTIYTIEFCDWMVKWAVRFSLLEDANSQVCSCSNAIYPWQIETMQWFSHCTCPPSIFIFCLSWVYLALLLRPMTWHAAMDDDTANIWRAAEEIKTNVCRMMMMMLNDNICSNKRSRKRVKEEKEIKKWHEIYGFTTAYVHSRLWHKSFDALLSRTMQGNSLHLCNENECIWSEFVNATNTAHVAIVCHLYMKCETINLPAQTHDIPFKWKCARKCVWNMNAN